MKSHPSNHSSGYIRLIILGVIFAIICLVVGLFIHWRPNKAVVRLQETLLNSVESNKGSRVKRLMSADYADRWNFSRDDIVLSMRDVRSQFLVLEITPQNQEIIIEGKTATVKMDLELNGTSIGGGAAINRRLNQLKHPFIFTWKKETFLPASWRLIRIENEAIPEDAWGYEPGSISNAMRGGDEN